MPGDPKIIGCWLGLKLIRYAYPLFPPGCGTVWRGSAFLELEWPLWVEAVWKRFSVQLFVVVDFLACLEKCNLSDSARSISQYTLIHKRFHTASVVC